MLPCILQSVNAANLTSLGQITFVPRDDLDRHRQRGQGGRRPHPEATGLASTSPDVGVHTTVRFHVDEIEKVIEVGERVVIGNVVDQQERVRREVGRRPETTILFLSGRVRE